MLFNRKSSATSRDPPSSPKPKTKSKLSRLTSLPYHFQSLSVSFSMTPTELDALFASQTQLSTPLYLTAHSLLTAGVAENPVHARKLYASLLSIGVVNAADSGKAPLNLELVDRRFPHKLTYLTTFRLKRLVHMLFAWESEIGRWHTLEGEEREVEKVLEGLRNGGNMGLIGEYEVALEGVRRRKVLLPSLRGVAGGEETLPAYTA
ncbi:MAG: hypothetical protein M1814_004115 [Vezdaea aestivalis]|nr:MAG: hypothetical protein M1814_004115 [Vezdaea aestivalis]